MKTFKIFSYFLVLMFIVGCSNKDEDNPTQDNTSGVLGVLGNSWDVKVAGEFDLNTKITGKEGNVYTLEVSYAKVISKTLKFGYTGNEVVDYVYSQGDTDKPFTMVKFDADVGDVYTSVINGKYHYRQVVEIETYNVPCLGKNLEMIGVYEEIPPGIPNVYFGLTITSIVWYWHPDYGLVCVEFFTADGNHYEVEFVQIDL